MRSISRKAIVGILLILVGSPISIMFGMRYLNDRSTYFISLCIICMAILAFLLAFESRKPQAGELVILSVFCALATVGRTAFMLTPQFKPMAALVIISGIALGGQSGFLVGAVSMFVSNFLFGQGPWTPWQMFAMGMVGMLAGVIFHHRVNQKDRFPFVCIFGFLSTVFIYGVLMDTASLLTMYSSAISVQAWLAVCVVGFPFNVIHGLFTVVFLFFLYRPMMKKLNRIQNKYG